MAIISAIVVFAYAITNAFGVHLPVEQDTIMGAVAAVLMVLVALGVIIDPTTSGIDDSSRAMTYEDPRKD